MWAAASACVLCSAAHRAGLQECVTRFRSRTTRPSFYVDVSSRVATSVGAMLHRQAPALSQREVGSACSPRLRAVCLLAHCEGLHR